MEKDRAHFWEIFSEHVKQIMQIVENSVFVLKIIKKNQHSTCQKSEKIKSKLKYIKALISDDVSFFQLKMQSIDLKTINTLTLEQVNKGTKEM